MDTTKEYIEMCEKTTEIQDKNKFKNFKPSCEYGEELYLYTTDFYAIHSKDGYWYHPNFAIEYHGNSSVVGYIKIPQNRFGCAVRKDLPKVFDYSEVIWLPRQDQLQGMISYNSLGSLQAIINYFNTTDKYSNDFKSNASHEQLWLAFTMSQLYNKVWSGTDWIKEDKE